MLGSVGSKTSRGGIGNESYRHDSDISASETVAHLGDSNHFEVVEWVSEGVFAASKSVDSGLVASVEGAGTVGRVGDQRVHGVRI